MTKQLPILYKKATTGAIQQWTIEIHNNSFRTIAGQIDGKLSDSEWTICQGKNLGRANETLPNEQAELEAKSKFQKKLDEGYVEDISDIDKVKFFKPMLAHDYKDYKDELKFPVYSQPKMDGIRSVVSKDGMFSRKGKPQVSCPHIYESLKPWLDKGYVFDGELYRAEYRDNFNKIASLVGKKKPTEEELKESKELVQYWIYDIPIGRNNLFYDRFCTAYLDFPQSSYYRFVYTDACYTEKGIDVRYEKYLEMGFEGQIIRTNSPYQNKRTKFLLKRKEFEDKEFKIIDIVEGEGNRSNMAGAVWVELEDGTINKSNIKGNEEFYIDLLKNKDKYIGEQGTIRFNGRTPDTNKLRFPRLVAIRNYE